MFKEDRSKFPKIVDGKAIFDLNSQKFTKLWHGPQHPGVTGNMSLELTISGDEVVECKTHVGYLHRGFEKLMEKRKYIQNFPLVCRICVPEPDFNEYLYATAIEDLAKIQIPEKAKWLRALTLEMAKLMFFTYWLGGQNSSFGMGTLSQWAVAHRDYMLDLFEELTGARIYHMYIVPGGVRSDLTAGFENRLEAVLQKFDKLLAEMGSITFNSDIFKKRAKNLGIITPEMVDKYGIVGPNARAAGFARDVRKDSPYLIYGKLDFDVITADFSDAYNRAHLRWQEAKLSINLIRQILVKMPKNGEIHTKLPNPLHWKIPAGKTYVRAETTRGEMGYFVVSDGSEYPRRIHVRGPSFNHGLALLEDLAVGTNIADMAGLMVSLHTCPPEIER
ncbi:MAG: NADH-quinone oxidoreductase subunit D [Candidatus Cloacimonetes bacterium]|jgi:NADH-quinone oxidoreductase subunit D|nr:NADH-quinone oxidoreductase subunit D [Candidatus Cloacimonadota bacterium]MBT7469135.1 NADH-quinone oxidoreductase subunit D [Candidatus Cloacimonadota bacterium]